MPTPVNPVEEKLNSEDAFSVANELSMEQLDRLKRSEELFELRHKRKARRSTLAAVSQALLGWVALAGIVANGYQSYTNKKAQEHQQEVEERRWGAEFARAREADRYRAFFETSMLATDPSNKDKRLVGYTLLQEFVDDKEYHSKATLTLEESLIQELRADTAAGLGEEARNAVVAILTSLAQTSDCRALEHAARSIDKIAKRHAKTQDVEETTEVFRAYVRQLVGRGAEICTNINEFRLIRRPMTETLMRHPEIGGLSGKIPIAAARKRVIEILKEECADETQVSASSDCPAIFTHYAKLCSQKEDAVTQEEEKGACDVVKEAVALFPAPQASAVVDPVRRE